MHAFFWESVRADAGCCAIWELVSAVCCLSLQLVCLFGYLVYTIDFNLAASKLKHACGFKSSFAFYYLCGELDRPLSSPTDRRLNPCLRGTVDVCRSSGGNVSLGASDRQESLSQCHPAQMRRRMPLGAGHM